MPIQLGLVNQTQVAAHTIIHLSLPPPTPPNPLPLPQSLPNRRHTGEGSSEHEAGRLEQHEVAVGDRQPRLADQADDDVWGQRAQTAAGEPEHTGAY